VHFPLSAAPDVRICPSQRKVDRLIMDITVYEFEQLADFIYRKTGIHYEAKKMYYLSKRIEKRMDSLGIDSSIEYIRFLRYSDADGQELQHFINLITVNETFFFRDFPQLRSFAEHSLPEVIARKSTGNDNKLRIWSAGCSTGEEPYTLAIILKEMLDFSSLWDIEILASDIDLNVLEKAKRAVFSERSIKEVPHEYLEKYFEPSGSDTYQLIDDELKEMIRFEHLNLFDKTELRKHRGYDFVFCRNVLIYFDDASRKEVVDHFYVALNRGGYIYMGSCESAGRITTAFKIKRAGDALVYLKE